MPDRLLTAVAISFLLCASVGLLTDWVPYEDLTHWTYDFLVNHGRYGKPSSDLVLVDFDDATFNRIQRYPIPRADFARVVQAVGEARPKLIGVDIFLSEPRSPQSDAAMQQALAAAGNVVLASQAGVGQLPPVLPLPLFCKPEATGFASGFCSDQQPGAYGYAFINMPIDSDGFIRQMELFVGTPKPAVSFPVMLAEEFTGKAIRPLDAHHAFFNGHAIPYADTLHKTVLIGHWSPEPVRRISAWSVLTGQVPPDVFRDKLVLIGQGSDAARDRHFTPIFRVRQPDGKRERLSGTEIHAAAIQTLLNGDAIAVTPTIWMWLVNLLVVGPFAYCIMRLRLRSGFIVTFGTMWAIYIAAQMAFTFGRLWFPYLTTELAVAAALPAGVAYQYVREQLLHSETRKQQEELMGLFSRYVDPEVAHTIWLRRNELSLAGEERVATVLFTDIRSFTALTAGKPSQTVLRWLNYYFTEMDDIVRAHGGFLNKFIGDGLLVVFGIPLSQGRERDAIQAVRTALAMLASLEEMNRQHAGQEDFPEIHIGIGIHTGTLTCGSVGSAKRLEYSVIGETVNLASRLEALTKDYPAEIILTESTYELVRSTYPEIHSLGMAKVRGFEGPVAIYTVNSKTAKEPVSGTSPPRAATNSGVGT